MLFGLPFVNYFDDYGRPLPPEISANGIHVSPDFPNMLGNCLTDDKTGLGRQIVFLGLQGPFP